MPHFNAAFLHFLTFSLVLTLALENHFYVVILSILMLKLEF
jgi:hypothetical protein